MVPGPHEPPGDPLAGIARGARSTEGQAAQGRRAEHPAGRPATPTEPHRENVPGDSEHASGEVEDASRPSSISGAARAARADDADDAELDARARAHGRPRRRSATSTTTRDVEPPTDRRSGGAAPAPAVGAAPRAAHRGGLAASSASCAPRWAELQRVQWPDRRQVGQATARRHRLRRRSPGPISAWPTGAAKSVVNLILWHLLGTENCTPCFAGTSSTPTPGTRTRSSQNIEHRASSLGQRRHPAPGRGPDRDRLRDEGGQKVTTEKRTMPGYVLVNMDLNEDSWQLVKGTPGRHRLRRRVQRARPADPARGRPPAAPRGRAEGRHEGAVLHRRVRQGRLTARCPTSRARSRRSTRTRPSSRSWCPSSAARRRSRSASTRSRRSRKAHAWPRRSSPRSSSRPSAARPARPRRSALRWASTASTSWSSARRSTPRPRQDAGTVIPVVITVYEDRSFTFVTKTPPAAVLIKQAIGLDKGSGEPHRDKVGRITQDQVRAIAEKKLRRPERARRRPGGQDHRRAPPARMGVEVVGLMAKHGKTYVEVKQQVDREHEYAPAEAIKLVKELKRAKFDESVEVHVRTGPERPPRRRAAPRHDRAAQRPGQGGPDRGLRPGRQGARGRGGRRRRRRRRGPRQARRGGLHRLRRRHRDAGHDAGRRPPRPGPRPAGQDAQPEGRHRDDGRPPRPSRSPRPARSSTAPTAPRSSTSYIGKTSFDERQLLENYAAVIDELIRAKPSAAKGRYLRSITRRVDDGPGIKVDPSRKDILEEAATAAAA